MAVIDVEKICWTVTLTVRRETRIWQGIKMEVTVQNG